MLIMPSASGLGSGSLSAQSSLSTIGMIGASGGSTSHMMTSATMSGNSAMSGNSSNGIQGLGGGGGNSANGSNNLGVGMGHGVLSNGHGGPAGRDSGTNSSSSFSNNEACGIKEVWAENLYDEFKQVRLVIQKYRYVAMDTEFPGVVARPIGEFRSTSDYQYNLLRCNVDLLKIIQLGLTFLDENGKPPPEYSTWQFNFKFNLTEDMFAQDSIDLLQNSGIQFKKHEESGIDPYDFAELLMTSDIVLNDKVRWLSFHSGYDFGYLLKILTDTNLPADESDFFDLLRIYFPTIYDVKYLMKSCKNLKGGLQEVADQLELERIGPQHQAGSDSLLTGAAFFKMREMFFEDNIDDAKYCGHLYGLGTTFVMNGNNAHADDTSTSSASTTPSTSTASTAATTSSSTTTTAVVIATSTASTTVTSISTSNTVS